MGHLVYGAHRAPHGPTSGAMTSELERSTVDLGSAICRYLEARS